MNRDLALADWLDELSVFGAPRRVQDAETAYHLSQLIQHRYIVVLALTHTPIRLRALDAPAPVPTYIGPELLKSSDQGSSPGTSSQIARPSKATRARR